MTCIVETSFYGPVNGSHSTASNSIRSLLGLTLSAILEILANQLLVQEPLTDAELRVTINGGAISYIAVHGHDEPNESLIEDAQPTF